MNEHLPQHIPILRMFQDRFLSPEEFFSSDESLRPQTPIVLPHPDLVEVNRLIVKCKNWLEDGNLHEQFYNEPDSSEYWYRIRVNNDNYPFPTAFVDLKFELGMGLGGYTQYNHTDTRITKLQECGPYFEAYTYDLMSEAVIAEFLIRAEDMSQLNNHGPEKIATLTHHPLIDNLEQIDETDLYPERAGMYYLRTFYTRDRLQIDHRAQFIQYTLVDQGNTTYATTKAIASRTIVNTPIGPSHHRLTASKVDMLYYPDNDRAYILRIKPVAGNSLEKSQSRAFEIMCISQLSHKHKDIIDFAERINSADPIGISSIIAHINANIVLSKNCEDDWEATCPLHERHNYKANIYSQEHSSFYFSRNYPDAHYQIVLKDNLNTPLLTLYASYDMTPFVDSITWFDQL